MVVMNLCHLVLVLEYDLDTKIFLSFIYMVQKQKQHNKKKRLPPILSLFTLQIFVLVSCASFPSKSNIHLIHLPSLHKNHIHCSVLAFFT